MTKLWFGHSIVKVIYTNPWLLIRYETCKGKDQKFEDMIDAMTDILLALEIIEERW